MTCHRTRYYFCLVPAEEQTLPPVDEVAACLCAEDIERHDHRPQSEGGGEDEVFRPCDDDTVDNLGLCAIAVGIVLEEKFHPPGPEEQTAEETAERLSCVALDEDTGDDNDESDEAHGKTGVVYRRRLHRLVHNHHHGVAQRHGEKHQKE